MACSYLTMRTNDPTCTACPLYKQTSNVCIDGRGPRNAKILAIGEAPGREEERTGQPFVGPAGQVLGDLLDQAGIDPESVYYTNAVSCRPPGNRKPTKREVAACSKWWKARLDRVQPRYVLVLGNTALTAVMGQTKISKARGRPSESDDRIYFPTYHPSFALREPKNRQPIVDDLKILNRIMRNGGVPRDPDISLRQVLTWSDVEQMLDDLQGLVSFDLETSGLYPWTQTSPNLHYDRPVITSIGFGTARHQWVIPWLHYEMQPFSARQRQRILSLIETRRDRFRLVSHGGKFDIVWLLVTEGVRWRIDHDTLLASHLVDENMRHGLDVLASRYLGAMDYDIEAETAPWDKLAPYHGLDLLYTRKLLPLFLRELREQDLLSVYRELSMPLQDLYADAESDGITIDGEKFRTVEWELREKVRKAKAELRGYADINWRSTPQLSRLLYKKLRLPILKRTPTGQPSTDEGTLKQLEHPMVEALLALRRANQQLSFFIDGWKPFLVDGRLHPTFKVHGTVTGRTSCAEPNLQQVDKDSNIRSLVVAPPGWVLAEFDLSQIELRIAAELSGDPVMVECFRTGKDLHWVTALSMVERGSHGNEALETAEMFCVQQELLANRTSAKVLLAVWNAAPAGIKPATFLQLCRENWKNPETRRRVWGITDGEGQSFMEGWCRKANSGLEPSKEFVRALWKYTLSLPASQGQKPKERDSIELRDAVQILSCIGARASQELFPIWKHVRFLAKAQGFGLLYGMWWKKFKSYARDEYGIKLTDEEAEEIYRSFHLLYNGLDPWYDRQRRTARERGYVVTLTGRRRRLPDAQLRDDCPERQSAFRQAINSPVQGFANEYLFMCAREVRERYKRQVLRIIATVHDSMLVLMRPTVVEKTVPEILQIMRRPALIQKMGIRLRVPIEAEVAIGPWGSGISLEAWCSK